MKNVALASLILASFSLNALAVPAEHNQPLLGEKVQPALTLPVMPVAADGADRVSAKCIAADGADRVGRQRIAADGADRIGGQRIAADGAERVGKPRVAEGGADRLLARRLA